MHEEINNIKLIKKSNYQQSFAGRGQASNQTFP